MTKERTLIIRSANEESELEELDADEMDRQTAAWLIEIVAKVASYLPGC